MTPDTFVSGEAASVAPLARQCYRAMYLPPNGASNAAFLETLRLAARPRDRTPTGADGLELAFATPRAVARAGTPDRVRRRADELRPGLVLARGAQRHVRAIVEAPARPAPQTLKLRLRLPRGQRVESVTVHGEPLELA